MTAIPDMQSTRGSGTYTGSAKKLSKTCSTGQHRERQDQSGDRVYDIESIKDYCFCPLYYRFKHISRIEYKQPVPAALLSCIYKACYFILYAAQHRFPSRGEVKNAYNRILKAMLGARRLRGIKPSTINRSFEFLLGVHEFLKEQKYEPVIIGQRYSLKMDDRTTISGRIDAVCRKGGKYELLLFMPEKTASGDMPLVCDIQVVAAALTCKKIVTEPVENVTVYYISSGTYETAQIESRDVKAMQHIVTSVVRAIENDIFYPAMSRNCRGECPYIAFCSNCKWMIEINS